MLASSQWSCRHPQLLSRALKTPHTRAACAPKEVEAAAIEAVHAPLLPAPPPAPQAACTPQEVKEVATMDPSIAVHAAPDQMAVSAEDVAAMKAVRLKRRIHEIITKVCECGESNEGCEWCPHAACKGV